MGPTATSTATLAATLRHKAAVLRMDSVRATSEAGSGHPSSCCSAADIVATLFFSVMRYDPKDPRLPGSDRIDPGLHDLAFDRHRLRNPFIEQDRRAIARVHGIYALKHEVHRAIEIVVDAGQLRR